MALEPKHKAEQVVRWIEASEVTPAPKEVAAYVAGKWPGLQPSQRNDIAMIAMGMTF